MNEYAAFNINLDSLGEAYGFPEGYRDPTFAAVMDRFLGLADRYGFRYTIFVIGRDLEHSENRDAVARWADAGHEIGNHTWTHPVNLGTLSRAEIQDQLGRTHEAVTAAAGREPRGFIAPNWSMSGAVVETLMDLGYSYDTSPCATLLLYPMLAKLLWNFRGDPRAKLYLRRADYLSPLVTPRQAYLPDAAYLKASAAHRQRHPGFVTMPLPTNRLRIATWHTTAFLFGERAHNWVLDGALDSVDAFYYLMHPADLMDARDTDPSRNMPLERMSTSLEDKLGLLERAIERVLASGREVVTMGELAAHQRRRLGASLAGSS